MFIRKISKSLFTFSSPKQKIPTINEIQQQWNEFSGRYSQFDYTPQTMYFSLMYMMNIEKATNILEVACGAGRMLPLTLNIKNKEANYFATDLAPEMIELTKKRLRENLDLYDSKLTFESWLEKNKLSIAVANAEIPFQKPAHITKKFDRIICNLVLMITENAEKMLKNLYNEAEEGCLMGVSVWGNKNNNPLMTSIRESYLEGGVPLPEERSNFHLYKKVPALAEKCGWETLVHWEQSSPFPALSDKDERFSVFVNHQTDKIKNLEERERVKKLLNEKLEKYFEGEKPGIHFGTDMLILRKK